MGLYWQHFRVCDFVQAISGPCPGSDGLYENTAMVSCPSHVPQQYLSNHFGLCVARDRSERRLGPLRDHFGPTRGLNLWGWSGVSTAASGVTLDSDREYGIAKSDAAHEHSIMMLHLEYEVPLKQGSGYARALLCVYVYI